MSQIKSLQLTDFRNLPSVSIQPSASFNVFYGNNGAGKTSVLEAIYYLGFGRSFRTSNSSRLIREDQQNFTLHSLLTVNDTEVSIGVERTAAGGRKLRQNNENIKSMSSIAELLPMQLIATDSYRFFHDGPKVRRQFMNWGLFHVEPLFFSLWQRLLALLKQRNAALKAKLPKAECSIWTSELVELTSQIDILRKEYIRTLEPILENFTTELLGNFPLKLEYNPGWDKTVSFEEALNQAYFKDQALGYTSVGPHRADLQLLVKGKPVGEVLSQGQQKLASYSLLLAQGKLLKDRTVKTPIYLIDDLPSELDPEKRSSLNAALTNLEAQVFITGITKSELQDSIKLNDSYLFHVEQCLVNREE